MEATVVRGGKFTFTIGALQLSKGLRPSKRKVRNSDFLTTCQGMVGREGTLAAIDQLTRIATTTITDGFPFPQIFVFTNLIIVCGLKKIYEWNGSSLSLKYTASAAGGSWSAVDFFEYVYLTNGKIAVVRSATSKAYSLSSTLPHGTAACNFNGQVLLGSTDIDGLGVDIVLPTTPFSITANLLGSISVT